MSKKEDKTKKGLSRREVIKSGLALGGVTLLAGQPISGTAQSGGWWGGGGSTNSPATTPFVDELPIPPVAPAVSSLTPAPTPAAFQRYSEFAPQKLYDVSIGEFFHSFHRDLPVTPVWGYNGSSPGPTFHARYNQPALVRFRNNLPPNSIGFGIPSVITHLHNAHTASESDGFPGDFHEAGTYKDHHYPNIYAGADSRESLGTLFYHDHRIDFTAPNVYKGLTGFYLLFDERDSGDENDTSPNALRLPSGEFDVPLMFSDKRFDAAGQLFFDQFDLDGFIGDKFTVNGKIQPYFKVARRKYRFRLVNAGPARFYEFFLSNGQTFTQISNDGNLLPAPLTRTSIRLSPGERADVIVDFINAPIGSQIFIQNRLRQTSGRGPQQYNTLENPGTSILRFDVDREAFDGSRIPAVLRTLPPVSLSESVTTRTWSFENRNGAWTVNGRLFDLNRVDASVKRGTAETWILRNEFRDWSHPIHIHFEEFQILSRNGRVPPADEKARKDVVRLAPGDEVRIFIRFRDFLGKYILHCHNLIHEDHAMMIRFDIVP